MERRATLLILHMDAAARQVCLDSGGDSLMEGDDVLTAIEALRDYFQPDAIDHAFNQVGKFMTNKRTDQSSEKFFIEFGISRRQAEKNLLQKGSGFPDLLATFLRRRAAQLKPSERTLSMATIAGNVDFV